MLIRDLFKAHRNVRVVALALASMVAISTPSTAAMVCAAPPQQLDKNVFVDGKAKIGAIGPIKAGDLEGKVSIIGIDLIQKYPNSDKILIAQMLISFSCEIIKASPNMTDAAKLSDFQRTSDKIISLFSPPRSQNYDWREDAKIIVDLYRKSGGGYYTSKIRPDWQFSNLLTIGEDYIALHSREIRGNITNVDLYARASFKELSEITGNWSGGDIHRGPLREIGLDCLAGQCVQWTGFHHVINVYGPVVKEEYNNRAVINNIKIPIIASEFTIDEIIIMQRAFARLISTDHSDKKFCEAQPYSCK